MALDKNKPAVVVGNGSMNYPAFHARSIQQRDAYWREQAQRLDWHRPFHTVCNTRNPPFADWFVGGQLNLCHNAVDRHVPHRPDQPALIFVSTETGTEQTLSYGQLFVEVQRMAAVLRAQGVGKGDRVLIYMPMIPEAVIAMLATVRLGAIHSVVFGGFAAHSLATRIDDASPKVIVSADAGSRGGKVIPYKPLLDEALHINWSSFANRPVYNTFDWGLRDADGYHFILGRTDDVINVAGHRLGTREIEEAVSAHAAVAEVAVVGVADELKGQVARAFVVVRDASRVADDAGRKALEAEIMQTVDQQIGAVGRPSRVYFVNALPKTRSGKLLRRAIQAVCEGRATGDLTTIEDPSAIQQLQDAVLR